MLSFQATRRTFLAVACTLAFALRGVARAQEPTAVPSGPMLQPLPDAAPRDGKPIKVVATTPILADLARQVGGSRVDVESLLPANADPHDFEPAPADIVKLEDADLVIEHGLGLDSWAADLVDASGNDSTVIATDGVDVIPSSEEGFSSGDPHVWFDPANVAVMASNVAAGLSQIDSDGANSYQTRLAAYQEQLAALDEWIADEIATIPPERRKLVTNHDAFAYFVRKYGLTFVGSVIPSLDSRAEPSAKETADLIDKIQAEGVPAIFTEASLNPALEQELADQAGITVVPNLYGDNLGEAGSGADTYIGMMITDTNLIVGALRPAT